MSTLELPKGGGGLGIRTVHLFNKALLAKQAVKIHNSSHSLISQVYCAKYKASPVNMVLNKTKLSRASWGFRGLCRAIQDYSEGFVKIIGDGSETNILDDKWLKGDRIKTKSGINLEVIGIRKVKDLMNTDQKTWNTVLIWKTFLPESSIRILTTYIPNESLQDYFAWSESKSGSMRVKDVYAYYLTQTGCLQTSQENRHFWSKFWASDLRPKWKLFLWRILQKALATNSNLIKRNIPVQERCHLCHRYREDENHLFRDCDISSRIWSSSTLGIKTFSSKCIPLGEWIKNFLRLFWKEDGLQSERAREFVVTLWSIWTHRNNIVFRDLFEDPACIIQRKHALLREYEESNKIKVAHPNKTPSFTKSQQAPSYSLNDTRQQDTCIILVDGAWKRHKQKHPRAGIGWSAYMNGIKIFEGNAAVMASSSLQTEAYAVYKGMCEVKDLCPRLKCNY